MQVHNNLSLVYLKIVISRIRRLNKRKDTKSREQETISSFFFSFLLLIVYRKITNDCK